MEKELIEGKLESAMLNLDGCEEGKVDSFTAHGRCEGKEMGGEEGAAKDYSSGSDAAGKLGATAGGGERRAVGTSVLQGSLRIILKIKIDFKTCFV